MATNSRWRAPNITISERATRWLELIEKEALWPSHAEVVEFGRLCARQALTDLILAINPDGEGHLTESDAAMVYTMKLFRDREYPEAK